jgi:hypothetical protein
MDARTLQKRDYEQVESLCRLGLTDAELADFFNTDAKTIDDWYLDDPDFRIAVIEGRTLQTARVADAMYQRAMGFSYTEEKSHVIDGDIVKVPLQKQALPDVTAQKTILAARKPDVWGAKETRTLQGPNGESINSGVPTVRVEDLSQDELELFKRMLENRLAAARLEEQA